MLFAALVICGFTLLGWFVRQLWLDLRDVRNYQITTLADLQTKSIDMQAKSLDVIGEVRVELCAFRKVLEDAPCGNAVREALEKHWSEVRIANDSTK